MKRTKPEHRMADVLRKVAQRIDDALCKGVRCRTVDATDLLQTLLSIADELDPPVRKKRRKRA